MTGLRIRFENGQTFSCVQTDATTASVVGPTISDILMFQNNETAAILVYQENPVGVELFSYVKASLKHSYKIRLIKFNSASLLHIPIEHADNVNKLFLKLL